METSSLHIAGIPALLAYQHTYQHPGGECAPHGTILYYHGFGGAKEDAREALKALTDVEFLAVALDSVGHGARRLPDVAQRIAKLPPGPELEAEFLTLVRATTQEVPAILDDLIARRLADPKRIGIAGWSMGGFVTYAAVVADPRIRAAVAILGSPEWRLPWIESPHRTPERFFPTALLSQTAGHDERVPPQAAGRFHEALEPYYMADPEQIRYIEYPGIDHRVPGEIADTIRQCMAEWFRQHLD